MKILIIDDHPLYIRGIQILITEMQPEVQLASAKSLQQAIWQLSQQRFDLLLLDIHLPDASGVQALNSLKMQHEAPIVVISADDGPQQIIDCIEAGAAGYIPKQTDPELMQRALEIVLAQGTYLPPHMLSGLHPSSSSTVNLSHKQLQVLHKLLQGKSNKVIARELDVAEGTIKAHLWAVYQQLGVNSRLQAMAKAHELGLFGSIQHAAG